MAAMRSKVRRILAEYGYPPDAEAKAIELVLEQAESFAGGVSGEGADVDQSDAGLFSPQ